MKFNKLNFEPYKDIFGYHSEIQKIDKGFRLYLDKKSKKLVIVNIYNNYEICNTFDCIFKINITNLRFLRIQNFNKILNFIEENNLKVEKNNQKEQNNFISYTTSEFIKLSNRTPNPTIKDINKIIGVTKC